jgi:hypothetical protein
MSSQDLSGTVSGIQVNFGSTGGAGATSGSGAGDGTGSPTGSGTGGAGGTPSAGSGSGAQNGQFRSGDIATSGGSFANYAGVQTASWNTGVGALNQAATALSANANISFGKQ